MKRTLSCRLLTFPLAVAMFFATGREAFGYQRVCAHHDAAARAVGTAHETDATGPAESEHAGHTAHDTSHAPDGHDGPCDCMGNCTVSTTASLVYTDGPTAVLQAPAARVVVRPTPIRMVSVVRADHLIPFATAPPIA